MSRREIRDQLFKLLFRVEFHNKEERKEQLAMYMEALTAELGEIKEEDSSYIIEKAEDISEHLEEIDVMINEKAEKWKTGRMAKAELAIIRLAVYEMKFDEDIPVSVAINEAVELAKLYGADNGPAFVNGVLAKLV